MQRATKAQFLRRVQELGCTIPPDMDDSWALHVDTPEGQRFVSTGCHMLAVPCRNHSGQSWLPQAYAEALQDMALGLEPCAEAECDYCDECRGIHHW